MKKMAANTSANKKLDILNQKFDKAAFGYKADEVDDFLEEVAAQMRVLTARNTELENKVDSLTAKLEEYRDEEDSLRAALIGAQKLGDSVVKDARAKAEEILQEANYTAKSIVDSSKRKIDSEKYTLTKLQKEVALFKSNLLSIYKQHLNLISTLPEYEEEEEKQIPQEPQEEEVQSQEAVAEESEEILDEEAGEVSMEEPIPEHRHARRAESKFGPLKFGAEYDISKDEVTTRRKK